MSFEEKVNEAKDCLKPTYLRAEGREVTKADWWQDGFEIGARWTKQELVELMFKAINGEMGCFTGDCPHTHQDECETAVRVWVDGTSEAEGTSA